MEAKLLNKSEAVIFFQDQAINGWKEWKGGEKEYYSMFQVRLAEIIKHSPFSDFEITPSSVNVLVDGQCVGKFFIFYDNFSTCFGMGNTPRENRWVRVDDLEHYISCHLAEAAKVIRP